MVLCIDIWNGDCGRKCVCGSFKWSGLKENKIMIFGINEILNDAFFHIVNFFTKNMIWFNLSYIVLSL